MGYLNKDIYQEIAKYLAHQSYFNLTLVSSTITRIVDLSFTIIYIRYQNVNILSSIMDLED